MIKITINLLKLTVPFIAIVLNNLEQAKAEQLKELRKPVSRDDLLDELATTQRALARLRKHMERLE